jgi:hypothetical protein
MHNLVSLPVAIHRPVCETDPMNIYTTLQEIYNAKPCTPRWRKLLKFLGKKGPDSEPLSILRILESNGIVDAEWAICNCPSLRDLRADYDAKRKTLRDDYWAKRKPLDADYEAKIKPLCDEYEAKIKPLDADYEAKIKPLRDDYWTKRKTLYDEYEAKIKPLRDEYEAKREAILKSICGVSA